MAHTPMQACTAIFQDFFAKTPYYETIPITFIVSYRGHQQHEDDIIIPMEWVLASINGIELVLENECRICGKSNVPLTEVKMALCEGSDVFEPMEVCDECLEKEPNF